MRRIESQLNVALIGFGFIAENGHLPAYKARKDIRIKAVVEPELERRKVALRLIPNVKTFKNFSDFLEKCGTQVDIVDICTPNVYHYHYVKEGLNAGKHVICEKPLALRRKEIYELIDLAQRKKLIIYPCHNYKFAPSLEYSTSLVQSGQIGTPFFANFRIFRTGHAKGVKDWKPDWRRDFKISGGGILADHGPHATYIAQSIFRQVPKKVSTHISNLASEEGQTEDTTLLCLDFKGKIVQITMTWASSARKSDFLIMGNKGQIIVSDDEVVVLNRNGSNTRKRVLSKFNDSSHSSWFQAMFGDFISTIKNQRIISNSLIEAITIAELIEKSYQSNESGGAWVSIQNKFESKYN